MKYNFLILLPLLALGACNDSSDSESKDMEYPVITSGSEEASPSNCQIYERGGTIPFTYVFTDDTELGAFNIEVHHNFDHHTHSTSSVECEMEPNKKALHPWIFNEDFSIPSGQTTYSPQLEIPIPEDIDTGDYHFVIRVTDRAGWQQICAVAVKIK